jgi:hypothetical protein
MASRPTLYLIDGNNQMYRAYHAIRGLSGPDGRSTNAVYGFVTMFRKLATDHRPDYIGASFDLAGPTFRDALAADTRRIARRCRTISPSRFRGCTSLRSARRADRQRRGVRGRRRDRDAGDQAAAAGSTSRS